MGLGLHGGGASSAKFFYNQGAEVLVTDLKKEKELEKSLKELKGLPIEYVLGEHREKDFKNADLIIKNPGVPEDSRFLKIAREAGVPVETDVNIFFKLAKNRIIGVTGTKGKSTISSLIYHLLRKAGKDVFLAGNIGVSPLEVLPALKKENWVVLELSSFELEYLEESPHIACVCSIYPDHLNRYKNLTEYIKAKKKIYQNQKAKDFLILNCDDLVVKEMGEKAVSQVFFYSRRRCSLKNKGCFLRGSEIFFDEEDSPLASVEDLKIKGEHNVSNALAALTVAKILKIPNKKIKKGLSDFSGVKNREETVLEKGGVKFINDTTATIPEAVVSALQRYGKNGIILIAGGEDKGLKYKKMAEEINKKVKRLVLLPGSASEKIKKQVDVGTTIVNSMEKAVQAACQAAEKGDIVLLSPGAASFNLFDNEFDRGDQFVKYIERLINNG